MKIKKGVRAKGFTLVELVLVIVVAAIAIPGVIFTFYELSRRSIYDEAMTTATMLAEGELERALQKNFANIIDENRDTPASFGGNFSAYSWQVRVDPVPDGLATDPLMSQYKQVEARVTNSITGDVSLKTVVTNN